MQTYAKPDISLGVKSPTPYLQSWHYPGVLHNDDADNLLPVWSMNCEHRSMPLAHIPELHPRM